MALEAIFRTGKNAGMLLAGTMTRMIASFVFVVYCADQLGVEGFGQYTIAVHYFELFLSLTATAVGILLTRDMSRWPRHSYQLMTSAIVLVMLMSVLSIVTMSTMGFLSGYSAETCQALMIASLALVPASACAVFEAVFVARERAEFVTIGVAIESLLKIGLSIALLAAGYGLLALMWVVLCVRLALMFAYLLGLARIGSLGWKYHHRRSLRFVNCWRMFAAENWMATIYTNLDVLVLSWFSGEVAVGIYNAAWKIVRLGAVVARAYTTAVFPVMSRLHAESVESFNRLYRHTIRVMFALALPAIAVISIVPDRMVGLLFNEEYAAAAPVLQVLAWVLLIDFLNPFLSYTLFAQGQQNKSMRVAGISLLVNSVATYALVLKFGAVGAAIGTVIGGFVAMSCYLLYAMPKSEVLTTVGLGLRVAVAALGMGIVVYTIRDSAWIKLLPVGALVYTPLLFVVGAIRIADLRFFQTIFLARASS
ncbi:flippase [Neorhodopirellula lusitana]|uniref:flippase n=1 Tax=Neorhodopirellula lusitana TaxID=445327 RepID=UPI00384A73CC